MKLCKLASSLPSVFMTEQSVFVYTNNRSNFFVSISRFHVTATRLAPPAAYVELSLIL